MRLDVFHASVPDTIARKINLVQPNLSPTPLIESLNGPSWMDGADDKLPVSKFMFSVTIGKGLSL